MWSRIIFRRIVSLTVTLSLTHSLPYERYSPGCQVINIRNYYSYMYIFQILFDIFGVMATFVKKSSVPDSCCLSDVVGCGTGILKLHAEQVQVQVQA